MLLKDNSHRMYDVRLNHRGVHYFHLLMKIYSSACTSKKLTSKQALKAAKLQILIVLNDRLAAQYYTLITASVLMTSVSLIAHGVGLNLLIGILFVSAFSVASAYLAVCLSELFDVKAKVRYGIWAIFFSISILVFFLAMKESLALDISWLINCLGCFLLILYITFKQYSGSLSFINYKAHTIRDNIIDMIPDPVKGKLIRLSARDKYVSVKTTKGEYEVRSTLAEAIKKSGQPGKQIHRSHWVASDYIGRPERVQKKWIMVVDDEKLPVSQNIAKSLISLSNHVA